MKTDRRLRAAFREIDVGAPQSRLEIEVEVKVDIGDGRAHPALVEEGSQPLILFGREDDGRRFTQRGNVGYGPRTAHKRLELNPTKVKRRGIRLTRPQLNARTPGEIVQAIRADHRKSEASWQLPRRLPPRRAFPLH